MFPLFSPFQWQQKVSIPRTAMAFVPWCRVDFRFRCGHLGSGNTTISERLNPPTSFTPNIIQYLQYIDWLMDEPYPSEKYETLVIYFMDFPSWAPEIHQKVWDKLQ
jgi:hypothetical protein